MPKILYRADNASPFVLKYAHKGFEPRIKMKHGEMVAMLQIVGGWNELRNKKDKLGVNMRKLTYLVRQRLVSYINDPSERSDYKSTWSALERMKYKAKYGKEWDPNEQKKVSKKPEWVNSYEVGKGLAALGAGIVRAGTFNQDTVHISTAEDVGCNGYAHRSYIYMIGFRKLNRVEFSGTVIGKDKLRLWPPNQKPAYLWISGSTILDSKYVAIESTAAGKSNEVELSFITHIPYSKILKYTDKKKNGAEYIWKNPQEYKYSKADIEKANKRLWKFTGKKLKIAGDGKVTLVK